MNTKLSRETPCLGHIDGRQCLKLNSKDTKFCSNCGTKNPAKNAAYDKVKDADTHQVEEQKPTVNASSSVNEEYVQDADENKSDQESSSVVESLSDEGITYSDEVKEGEVNDNRVKSTSFGLESLKDVVFTDEAIGGIEKDVLQILTKDGPEATIKYISDTFNSWKRTTVRIAVAGKSAVGKSAFINTVRGVNNTDQGYAAEGLGDTTMEVQEYPHPINKQIIYCDLPGYGTVTMTKEKFLEKVKLLEFDMFFIFIYPVPTQDDEWLVEQLIKAGRQFCFVRGKLDRDIKNAKKMGKKEENVIEEIRKKIQDSTKNMPSSKGVDIFCISNKNTSVGEIHDLINFLKGKIPTIKFEAVMFSLPALVDKVIEIKYTILKDRVSSVSLEIVLETLRMGIGVIDISAFYEIILYFETFLLNNKNFSKIPNLKHPFSDQHINNTLLLDLQNKVTGGFKRLIPFYNLFASHRVCKQFLIKLLDELKEDYQTVHRFLRLNQIQCTKQNV